MKKINRKGIIVLIILLSIGFAAVSTSLVINGTSIFGTNSDNFEVIFTESILDGVDISGDVISQDGKSITYKTNELTKVGETSVLEFEVTNNSTQYDANVSIECVSNGEKKNYYEITPNFVDIIHAKEIVTGTIIVELKNNTTEEIEEKFTCTIKSNAVEKVEIPEITTYRLTGNLVDENDNPISNASIVVYSETPTYATTDEYGKFVVTGLELGAHELYYVANKTIEELELMDKEEIKEIATSSAIFSTNAIKPITGSNGYNIIDSELKDESTIKWKYTDSDNNGIISIGDMYSYKDEKFNVINQTEETITMLAQYNLGTNYKQSLTANCVSFSNVKGWEYTPGPKEINIQSFAGNAKNYVNSYVTYLQTETEDSTLSGNLITLKELKTLGCTINDDYTFTDGVTCANSSNASWLVNNQFWWTRSALPKYSTTVWRVNNNGYLFSDTYSNSGYGIRPIVTISKSAL